MSSKNKRLLLSLAILLILFGFRYYNKIHSNPPLHVETSANITTAPLNNNGELEDKTQNKTTPEKTLTVESTNDIDDLIALELLIEVKDKNDEIIGWQSQAGLFYGLGSKEGNRIYHVFTHLKPDDSKPIHSVFDCDKTELIALLDKAWQSRDKKGGKVQANGNRVYDIDMGKSIGSKGEQIIRLVIRDGTKNIITAYPKAK